MKKIIFLFSFVLLAGMMSAQTKACSKTCKKTCAKKAGASTTMTEVGSPAGDDMTFAYVEADKLADTNEDLEKRVCEKSGTVSYYQKSVCAESGKESWSEVEYCTKSKAFKAVAEVEMEADQAAPATGGTSGGM